MKSIVLTTDFSDLARAAYPTAVVLAKKLNTNIHLVHIAAFLPSIYSEVAGVISREEAQDDLNARLKSETEHPALGDVRVETSLLFGAVSHEALLDFARIKDCGLIVLSTHGRSGLGHFLLGSFLEHLLRHSHVPVLTHRPGKTVESSFAPDSVVVPFDLSECSRAVFPTVRLLAEHFNSKFTFLHVPFLPEHFFYGRFPDKRLKGTIEEVAAIAKQTFYILRESEFPQVEATFEAVPGTVSLTILERAKALNADLILMATHGWTGPRHLPLGSIAEKVIRKASCPVWAVRPQSAPVTEGKGAKKVVATSEK